MRRPSGSVAVALLGALILIVASAAGAAAYEYLGGIEPGLAAGALALAAAIGAIVLIRDQSVQRRLTELASLRGEIRRLRLDFERLIRRVDDLEEEEPPGEEDRPQPLLAELDELRRTLGTFASSHVKVQPPPQIELPSVAISDHSLELFLEPVVALVNGRTMHYRAAIVLEAPDGRHVPYEELSERLDAHALRSSLDVHCLARVLPITRKLVLRRQNTLVFVPVGGETLANADAMRQLAALLRSDEGFAASIAFEIDHGVMAGLSADGVEGLAALARQGAAMALTRAEPEGIDLAALRNLRFAFLSFPAASLPKTMLGKPAWSSLARFAGDHGFVIEVRGLDTAEEAARAKKWAQLGSGRAFAPPRRVRSDAGALGSFSAAA